MIQSFNRPHFFSKPTIVWIVAIFVSTATILPLGQPADAQDTYSWSTTRCYHELPPSSYEYNVYGNPIRLPVLQDKNRHQVSNISYSISGTLPPSLFAVDLKRYGGYYKGVFQSQYPRGGGALVGQWKPPSGSATYRVNVSASGQSIQCIFTVNPGIDTNTGWSDECDFKVGWGQKIWRTWNVDHGRTDMPKYWFNFDPYRESTRVASATFTPSRLPALRWSDKRAGHPANPWGNRESKWKNFGIMWAYHRVRERGYRADFVEAHVEWNARSTTYQGRRPKVVFYIEHTAIGRYVSEVKQRIKCSFEIVEKWSCKVSSLYRNESVNHLRPLVFTAQPSFSYSPSGRWRVGTVREYDRYTNIPGVTYDDTTGKLSGTPTRVGSYYYGENNKAKGRDWDRGRIYTFRYKGRCPVTVKERIPPVLSTIDIDIDEPSGTQWVNDSVAILGTSKEYHENITVTVSTKEAASNTATAGSDYKTLTDFEVVISPPPSASSPIINRFTVPVELRGDSLVEGDERFLVELKTATNATLPPVSERTATVTIIDDDAPGVLFLTSDTDEGDEGETVVDVAVVLASDEVPDAGETVTVHVATSPGTLTGRLSTAEADVDYRSETWELEFTSTTPGNTITIPVTIFGDTDVEEDEHFYVRSGLTHGEISIRNDDLPPSRTWDPSSFVASSSFGGPDGVILVGSPVFVWLSNVAETCEPVTAEPVAAGQDCGDDMWPRDWFDSTIWDKHLDIQSGAEGDEYVIYTAKRIEIDRGDGYADHICYSDKRNNPTRRGDSAPGRRLTYDRINLGLDNPQPGECVFRYYKSGTYDLTVSVVWGKHVCKPVDPVSTYEQLAASPKTLMTCTTGSEETTSSRQEVTVAEVRQEIVP